jgi:hypothetical protein
VKLFKYILIFFSVFLLTSCQQHSPLPPLMLWVWQAPQDLRGLDAQKIGVAVYVGTITINAFDVSTKANSARMIIPDHLYKMAVVHINVIPYRKAVLDQNVINKVVANILLLFHNSNMPALQLDFSATNSQRDFYAQVIRQVKQQLDPKVYLSITALASWCVGDRWIAEQRLPVDLVVPMYFSLAQKPWDKFRFVQGFPSRMNALAPECRNAIGVATFETWNLPLHADVPVFVFTRGSWTREKIKEAIQLQRDIITHPHP